MQELKNIKLRDYQENILNELKDLKSIGLFFGTGSGKTITSLARVIYNNNHFRTTNLLVICPSTIISQWNEVIKKHTDFEVLDYKLKASAKVKNDIINEFIASDKFDLTPKAVVVNYDIMSKLDLDFIDNNWTIILDEAHKIKNGYDENKRTKKITRGINSYKIIDISRNTDYKIILTATSCEKDYGGYIDYYYLLNFLGLMTWNYRWYKDRYCTFKELNVGGFLYPIKVIDGYKMDLIEKEVLPIVKKYTRFYEAKFNDFEPQHIKVDIERCASYPKVVKNRAYQDIVMDNNISFIIGLQTLTGGTISSQAIFYKDNSFKVDWLKEFINNNKNEKLLVFYNYNVELEEVRTMLEKENISYITLNGATKNINEELKKDYQVVVAQFKTASEGLDGLQEKIHISIYYSMPTSSVIYRQSLGRINRIGQEKVPLYYYLCMVYTIDDKIYRCLQSKVDYVEKDIKELLQND